MSKTVTEIVKEYLKSICADGLCNDENASCGCQIGDLFTCDNFPGNCFPARKVYCRETDCPSCENIGCDGFKPDQYLMWKKD